MSTVTLGISYTVGRKSNETKIEYVGDKAVERIELNFDKRTIGMVDEAGQWFETVDIDDREVDQWIDIVGERMGSTIASGLELGMRLYYSGVRVSDNQSAERITGYFMALLCNHIGSIDAEIAKNAVNEWVVNCKSS